MFLGAYYADCLMHEFKEKPYSKNWLLVKHILRFVLISLLIIVLLIF